MTKKAAKQVRAARPAGGAAALRDARAALACALRWAARFGLSEGVCNHFSVAVAGAEERYLINPHGIHWSEMRASDMLLVDAAGNVLEGKHEL